MRNSPERPKFQIKLPEIPQGEDLQAKIVEWVNEALISFYPILGDQPYKSRLISQDRLVPTTPMERVKLEQEDSPQEHLQLYQALFSAGIPIEILKDYYDRLSIRSLFYWDPTKDTPTLFVDRELIIPLDEQDSEKRWYPMLHLVMALTRIDLNILAYSHPAEPLPNLPWREVFRNHFEQFFYQTMTPYFRKDSKDESMENIRQLANGLLDEAQFFPRGAGVELVLAERKTTEYFLGKELQINTIAYLAEPVRKRLFNLLRNKWIIHPDMEYRWLMEMLGRTEYFEEFRELEREITKNREIYKDAGFTSEEAVLSEYLAGTLPAHLSTTKTGKFDFWQYR